jgi:3-hydroxyisobutyrate dehydrogenase
MTTYGFIGIGNMGAPMAANLAKVASPLHVYDQAGTRERAPAGTRPADSLAALVAQADAVFVSVPDVKASLAVAAAIAAAPERKATTVIDLSTVGAQGAREVFAKLAQSAITYIDCPVSGGAAGARAATLTGMWGGPANLLEQHRPALQAMMKNIFHVGDEAGQGQAMKLLNNFLSATAMAATSEAMLFGLAHGLDMKTMLDVVNVSTGRNTATSDKFVNRVLTGTFDAGFYTALMSKDVQVYLQGARQAHTPDGVAQAIGEVWQAADRALPGSDFTRIYEFLKARVKGG